MIKSEFNEDPVSNLIKEISCLTLENLGVVTAKQFNDEDSNILSHFDRFMSHKKMHEVLQMSEFVANLCKRENVTNLVDVGSGKAYLSQVLAAMHKQLDILAIDSQSGNLKGAQKRSANLEVILKQSVNYVFHPLLFGTFKDAPKCIKIGKCLDFDGIRSSKNDQFG